ncbi:winged helix-turn-helix transcriptional regulator [Candidatus Woesearchaeota archaeon]|nr:winged helix-turn-helix transcriptional regulator [Candidatus Woesearchaeota archaeon]
MIVSQKITIVRISKPARKNINEELQWFGSSLGLFGLRDKDKSLFRLFIELLKAAKMKQTISSDELAERMNLSRGTVIHHINKLIDSGIVVQSRNRYILRVDKLEELVEEIQKDINRTCSDLKEIAKDIDQWIGV